MWNEDDKAYFKFYTLPNLLFTALFFLNPTLRMSVIVTAHTAAELHTQRLTAVFYAIMGYLTCKVLIYFLYWFAEEFGIKKLAVTLFLIFLAIEGLAIWVGPTLPNLQTTMNLFEKDFYWEYGVIYVMKSRYHFFVAWIWEWIFGLLFTTVVLKGWQLIHKKE